MKTFYRYLITLFLTAAFIASSQPAEIHYVMPEGFGPRIFVNSRIKVSQGDPEKLDLIEKVKISFDYSEMWICKYKNVNDYLEHQNRKKSKAKKEVAIKLWHDEVKKKFESHFCSQFNYRASEVNISSSDTAYIQLRVKVLKIEPHRCKYDHRELPYVYMTCEFVGKQGEEYVTYELTSFGSRNKDDDERMEECFLNAGKMLGAKVTNYFSDKEIEKRLRYSTSPGPK